MPGQQIDRVHHHAYPIKGAHHDGSHVHVSNPYPAIGECVTLRVRVGDDLEPVRVALRSTPDGDQQFTPCEQEPRTGWWSTTIVLRNHRLSYRFLIDTGAGALTLNGTGLHDREVTDAHDFRITADPAPPSWAAGAVVYEVFIDRFARAATRSIHDEGLPDWAIPADWGDDVVHGTPEGVRQLYGGNLAGIEARLDHLRELGVTGLYLTPFFPAESSHRYDAASFQAVDPLLGGDEALASLVDAAHRDRIRVIGDLTLNHTGSGHEWFLTAREDASSPEAGYYLFGEHPDAYETFAGVRTMPKLDHRSVGLQRRLFDGKGSVVHRYLADFGLDGWRIDVAQSAGHAGASNRTLDSAAQVLATARAARADAYVVAEHQFDASAALAGSAWHGTMAYAAFTRPLWSWLAEEDIDRHWGVPGGHRPYTGTAMAEVMDDFNALLPWRSRVHSLNLLDSHDTPRLLSVIGRERYVVALGMLMTMPGIPMIFSGDEIATWGADLEDGRRPFRWDRSTWDHELFALHQELIRLRRTNPALTHGGFRWLHTDTDVVLFERATAEQTVIVRASRRRHPPITCPVDLRGLHGCRDLSAGSFFPDTGPVVQVWSTASGD